MHITVLYSLPTKRALASPYKATDEDTKDSAEEVAAALREKGADVTRMPLREDTIDSIREIRADCIFNQIEWDGFDIELSLKAFRYLEETKIPFTGPRLSTFQLASDKIKMKKAMDAAHILTPTWQLFASGDELIWTDFQYPVIVKLALEHCSIGLTKDAVVNDASALINVIKEHIRVFKQPVFVEEFIEGREFQVTVLERKNGPVVLPPAEITFKESGNDAFLTFNGRWDESHPDYSLSGAKLAELSPTLKKKLEQISLDAFRTFHFEDYARLDIRTRNEDVFILEANTNPGLGESDDYGMTISHRAAGMDFSDFVWQIVESCMKRFAAK